MNENRIIELENENDFLRRENAALMAEVVHLRSKLAEAEQELSGMRVDLHIARREAKDAQKSRQARRGGKFEPDDDVKQALRELANFNRS